MNSPTLLPREKLKLRGAASLSDEELLKALIGSGNKQAGVSEIAMQARKVLCKHGAEMTYEQLSNVAGLGQARICEMLAAFELGRRYLLESERPVIDRPEAAVAQLADIRDKKQEHFVCLTLDGANRSIAKRIITIGTLTSSLVHPREVFADAITDRAASIIVAHNHPSGSLTASTEDLNITLRLRNVSEIMGLPLIWHLILTKHSYSVI